MPRVLEIKLSSKITKSANYQSGTGEFGVTVELYEGEDMLAAFHQMRNEVTQLANQMANDALTECP
jgi:hypothetical protein